MIKGMVRQFDRLGRIVIPKEMRKALKLNEKDPVDIYFRDGVICIEPCRLQCVHCGSKDEEKIVELGGLHYCRDCAIEVSKDMKKYGILQ